MSPLGRVRWAIREERAGDERAIHEVNAAAFADHPHSEGTEPFIVDALRADGDLMLSLVAEDDPEDGGGAIIGHAAFSAAILSNGETGWATLGPIAVLPGRQGEGVGRALIDTATRLLRERGARGIVLLGDPALYARLGFTRETPLHVEGPLADYFHAMAFTDAIPRAAVTFAPAFRLARVRDRG